MGFFLDDLKKGKEAEIKLMNKLNELGMYIVQNPNNKEVDLILCERGIEVKLDDYSQYSGNFYIEFECNDKPSGIFRDERLILEYWAQCTSERCLLINGNKLREYVIDIIPKCRNNKSLTHKGIRLVEKGGNGGRTKGLLIPINKLEELSDLVIIL